MMSKFSKVTKTGGADLGFNLRTLLSGNIMNGVDKKKKSLEVHIILVYGLECFYHLFIV